MKEQVSTLEKGANILLSLMQLNIGGAETHVVELAKELKRKGFNVIVIRRNVSDVHIIKGMVIVFLVCES